MTYSLTSTGISALASAITGAYTPPLYLVIDTTKTTLAANTAAGATSFQTNARVDQAGDTKIIVGLGTIGQEVATFSAVSGVGPYTYTCTALVNAHSAGDYVIRNPLATDTLSNVVGEIQYDSTNDPGNRVQVPAGFSPGTGQWDASFYITASQGIAYITAIGVSETQQVGAGNLHAYVPLGFDHTSGTRDLQVDLVLTLT